MPRASRFFVALVLAASMALPARAADKIAIGTQQSVLNAGLFLAAARGYFAEEGLEVDLKAFATPQDATAALAAGQVDFALTEFTASAFNLAGKGVIKIIAGQARENADFEGSDVVASVGAFSRGLKKFPDLAGRKIAITELGGNSHYQVALIARRYDFDFKGVTLMPMKTLDAVSAAVVNGVADAAVLPVDYARDALTAGQARLVGWCSEVDEQQLGALFTTARNIAGRRGVVEGVVRAYRKGAAEFSGATMRRDRSAKRVSDTRSRTAAELVSRYVYPKLSADRGMQAIESSAYYIDADARVNAEDIKRQFDWYKAQGLLDGGASFDAVIDASFPPPAKKR